jgi:hypothetical protein
MLSRVGYQSALEATFPYDRYIHKGTVYKGKYADHSEDAFWRKGGWGQLGTSAHQLRKALRSFGLTFPIRAKLASGWSLKALETLPVNALIWVEIKDGSHWMVWDADRKRHLDPSDPSFLPSSDPNLPLKGRRFWVHSYYPIQG